MEGYRVHVDHPRRGMSVHSRQVLRGLQSGLGRFAIAAQNESMRIGQHDSFPQPLTLINALK